MNINPSKPGRRLLTGRCDSYLLLDNLLFRIIHLHGLVRYNQPPIPSTSQRLYILRPSGIAKKKNKIAQALDKIRALSYLDI
jgi:hypothetical protein